jgi:biopolymer transport protein ExbD
LQLPVTNGFRDGDLPGTGNPTVSVAIAAGGQFYFANQSVDEKTLRSNLAGAVKKSREPLTLLVYADKSVTLEQLVRMTLVAREAGIYNTLLATLPRGARP